MNGAVLVAIAAAVGNLLQGWDNATIAASVLYIKKEFNLETQPAVEGLIVAMSLIGATLVTAFSGTVADRIGRRPMLIISSLLYFFSGIVMFLAPNIYVLLLARFLDGLGIGLAVTLVPLYISETAPPEIRGSLNTLPQFTGSGGMFLSYCMVFVMSLTAAPSWRLMLGVLSIPSLVYFALSVFFLPESPRWLVSKGRMVEAKKVLEMLRGKEDVSAEMALLVEGLGVGGQTSIEEYITGPDNIADLVDDHGDKLYGTEQGQSWVARPVDGLVSTQQVSVASKSGLVDPLVTLFGSAHESKSSMLISRLDSMFSVGEDQPRHQEWDVESQLAPTEANFNGGDSDYSLHAPLISRRTTSNENNSILGGEMAGSTNIGGGWQLVWKWSERRGHKEGGLQRIYLHQEGVLGSCRGSNLSIPEDSEFFQAAGLVSQPALCSREQNEVVPAMVNPAAASAKGTTWRDVFDQGVKHALVVGVGIQILQQFSGINGVLYYTPQILEQAGVEVLLSNLGLSSASASLFISGLITLLMLPSIAVAMRLMDISGRRSLLLTTIPILIFSLVILVLGSLVNFGSVVNASILTSSVVLYFCAFVMGFGPVPNILCAEIFPTRVRGLCIAICALIFWIGDIIVTYSLPLLLKSVGLAGVFGMYAVVCVIAWIFVYMKVPETKGMPLEVITDLLSAGAKKTAAVEDN